MDLAISPGNTKLGRIPNISLPPGGSCTAAARATCYGTGCYARRFRPSVLEAYRANLAFYRLDDANYFAEIGAYLSAKKPRLFRWHVAGDIPTLVYLSGMRRLAAEHPETRFLAYTKFPEALSIPLERNLRLIWSAWPGVSIPSEVRNVAYLRDPRNPDPRIPSDAVKCPTGATCDKCARCWSLRPGQSVVFDRH